MSFQTVAGQSIYDMPAGLIEKQGVRVDGVTPKTDLLFVDGVHVKPEYNDLLVNLLKSKLLETYNFD